MFLLTGKSTTAAVMADILASTAITVIFATRDAIDRVARLSKTVLSHAIYIAYLFGSICDPLWRERWGSEANIQTHFWTGLYFPLQEHSSHAVYDLTPKAKVWGSAFQNSARASGVQSSESRLAVNGRESRDASHGSSRILECDFLSSTVTKNLDNSSCFEEAHNLPRFDDKFVDPVTPIDPATPTNASMGAKSRFKTPLRPTKIHTQHRRIFPKWTRAKRSGRREDSGSKVASSSVHKQASLEHASERAPELNGSPEQQGRNEICQNERRDTQSESSNSAAFDVSPLKRRRLKHDITLGA